MDHIKKTFLKCLKGVYNKTLVIKNILEKFAKNEQITNDGIGAAIKFIVVAIRLKEKVEF